MFAERVLSGMRPTGALHLGHYHGVLKNWVELQSEYPCFFFVADWHALTTHYETSSVIEESVWEMVIDNPLIDLERWGTVSLVVIVVLILTRRRWAGKCRTCCGRRRGGRGRSKTLANRDLDV